MKKFIGLFTAIIVLNVITACNMNNTNNNLSSSSSVSNSVPNIGKTDFAASEMKFNTSDETFNNFLNEFYKRHLRYDDAYKVGDLPLGSSVMFAKQWETQSVMWFDTTRNVLKTDDAQARIKSYLNTIDIDKFGNAYVANYSLTTGLDRGTSPCQGWPFPTYTNSMGQTIGWEFNQVNTQMGEALSGWSVGNGYKGQSKDGFLFIDYAGGIDESFKMTSADLVTKKADGTNKTRYVISEQAPFVEIDMRIKDKNGFIDETDISEIRFEWKNDASENWHSVNQTFATREQNITYDFTSRMYLPMYLNSEWSNHQIKNIRLVIVPKSGKNLDLTLKMNYIRLNYDTRQSNNASIYISALNDYVSYTNDIEMLKDNLSRARQCMMFLTETLKGYDGRLDLQYFVGKNAISSTGNGIGNGYWDIIVPGRYNFDADIYYYKALRDMAYLEDRAAAAGISLQNTYVYNGKNDGTRIEYNYTSSKLREIMQKVKSNSQKDCKDGGYWIPEKGRFAFGLRADNTPIDYGYIFTNQEAISAGIPTKIQQAAIMDWVTGKKLFPDENSTGEDIYKYEFGPRATTIANKNDLYWMFKSPGFGEQVQDGGAILYTSYFDLISRIKVLGADDSFERFKNIQKWYEKVSAAGGVGIDFYRSYYTQEGIIMQGLGDAGAVGVDAEFLESSLVYTMIPYGYLGLDANILNTISFSPDIPQKLTYVGIDNMLFSNIKYSVKATNKSFEIFNIKGRVNDKMVTLHFKKPSGVFKVTVDGKEFTDYKIEEDKIIINTSFNNTSIIIS